MLGRRVAVRAGWNARTHWRRRRWGAAAGSGLANGDWDGNGERERALREARGVLGHRVVWAVARPRAFHGCRGLLEESKAEARTSDRATEELTQALSALKDAKIDVREARKRKEIIEKSLAQSIGMKDKEDAKSKKEKGKDVASSRERKDKDKERSGLLASVGDFSKLATMYATQFLRNPLVVKKWTVMGWQAAKDMAHHTYAGFKLLGVEIRTSWNLVRKRLGGHQLTRRERRQLVRTTADLARVVPFTFFIIVPFMEFLLPFALRIFPNMLPSTFQDQFKKEETMKRQLKLRIQLASFLQDMVYEMEDKVKARSKEDGEETITVDDVQHFMERVRMGRDIDEETTLKVAKLFSDELTTDNMSRSQLVTLCRYMGLAPYGGDQFLRFQLRSKINSLRDDDATIFFEDVESLNLLELKQACEDRGMRATGLTMHQLRSQLKRWIDLSVNKNVPLSLLILSRAFTLNNTDKAHVELAISEAISQMDPDVLQEALIAGAESNDLQADKATLSKLKLEAIQAQNDLIEMEIKEKARKQAFIEQLRKKAEAELQQELDQHQLQAAAAGASEALVRAESKDFDRDTAATPQSAAQTAAEAAVAALLKRDREAAAAAVADDDEDGSKKESVREMEEEAVREEEARKVFEDTLGALKILASSSPVAEEKESLEEIMEKQEEIEAAKAVSSGRIVESEDGVGVAGENEEPEKRTRSLLKNKVKRMLDKLEVDVETVNQKIGDKLSVLDLDRDGRISQWEIRKALIEVLKKRDSTISEEKLEELIRHIDADNDGLISLEELEKYLGALRSERAQKDGE